MSAILTKSQTVLRQEDWDEGSRYFGLGADVETPHIWIDNERWEDMGRPDTITVTIEPGDRLNEA